MRYVFLSSCLATVLLIASTLGLQVHLWCASGDDSQPLPSSAWEIDRDTAESEIALGGEWFETKGTIGARFFIFFRCCGALRFHDIFPNAPEIAWLDPPQRGPPVI